MQRREGRKDASENNELPMNEQRSKSACEHKDRRSSLEMLRTLQSGRSRLCVREGIPLRSCGELGSGTVASESDSIVSSSVSGFTVWVASPSVESLRTVTKGGLSRFLLLVLSVCRTVTKSGMSRFLLSLSMWLSPFPDEPRRTVTKAGLSSYILSLWLSPSSHP